MRKTLLVILALSVSAAWSPTWALQANDTMASWSKASAGEKYGLVSALLRGDGRETGVAGVMKCLDAASGIAGHAELLIQDLVKVCEKEGGEPV